MGSESGTFGYGTSELTTTTPHTYVYSLHVVTRVHTYAVLTRTQVDLSLSLCHRRTGCYCHRWPLLKREKWGEKICFVEWCVPSVPFGVDRKQKLFIFRDKKSALPKFLWTQFLEKVNFWAVFRVTGYKVRIKKEFLLKWLDIRPMVVVQLTVCFLH